MIQRLAEGWTIAAVAAAAAVDPKTVRKWRQRYAAEGEAGLVDRSSRPHHSPTRLSAPAEAAIEALRRQRWSGPAIARELDRPVATVGEVLRRLGLGRLSALDPKPPVIRYQREQPGELLHIDVKKLGKIDGVGHRITGDRHGQKRGRGWEFLHVCVDDASRLAYTEILPDERQASAVAFLERIEPEAVVEAPGEQPEARVAGAFALGRQRQRVGILCQHHLGLGHRRGEQQLERAQATLFGEQPHDQDRHAEQEQDVHLEEQMNQARKVVDEQRDSAPPGGVGNRSDRRACSHP